MWRDFDGGYDDTRDLEWVFIGNQQLGFTALVVTGQAEDNNRSKAGTILLDADDEGTLLDSVVYEYSTLGGAWARKSW